MPRGTLRVNKGRQDAYVHYDFVCVKCSHCGAESNPFVHKDHLNADETIEYVLQITGFTVDKLDPESHTGSMFVNTGKYRNRGGLVCPICNENKLKEAV